MIGQTLSHYRIVEKLGAGGMGEVYVAEDTKLSRKVALKVLPPEMAENAERRARFEREAKAVAALDHPNIVTIYSVEEAEGVHFYTMQLVKGKTLTEFIPKNGMALNKFFEVAIPLADAVSAAHEQGIIHRDLKPDNLMVGDDGRLKILDFGLAKLKPGHAESGISELPTQSATAEGRILGTVAYMSPEQTEGKTVDNRSDVFSIGIILYEMVTGERPFTGDTATSLISSILKDTPKPATEVNPALPRELGKIIRRCLNKDPMRRYQNVIDLWNELEELKQEVESGVVHPEAASARSPRRKWIPALAFVAGVLLAATVTYLMVRPGLEDQPVASAVESELIQLTSASGEELFPSLSPDGEYFLYSARTSGNWDIYLLRVGGENAMNLTADSANDDIQAVFSPDGKSIAFRSERDGGGIFLMGATGESVRRLTEFGFNPAWSPDGKEIVFAEEHVIQPTNRVSHSQLWRVNVETGEKRLITERDAVQPHWSPNGHRIAFWSVDNAEGNRTGLRDIWTIPADGGDSTQVTNDLHVDWNPIWSPDGRHLYFSSDRGGSANFWRVAINEESGELLGPPEAVTAGASASRQHLSFATDGNRGAYVERVESRNLWKANFDPANSAVLGEPIAITRGSRVATNPDLSPEGDWLTYNNVGSGQEDIFVIKTDGSGRRQLTDDRINDRLPRWAPDGKRIAFYSNRSGSYEIWTIRPDGSELKQLTEVEGVNIYQSIWAPDGRRIAYFNRPNKLTYIFEPDKPWNEQKPIALPPMDDPQQHFIVRSWSPDGRSLAGQIRNVAGTTIGIGVYSFENKRYMKATDHADDVGHPAWLSDSRRLLHGYEGKLYMLDTESGNFRELLSIFPDRFMGISVSSDNRWIYFGREENEADIWMLTLNEEPE